MSDYPCSVEDEHKMNLPHDVGLCTICQERSRVTTLEADLAETRELLRSGEAERDAALGEARALRQQLDEATAQCNGLGCGKCASCASAALAQVAVLREALEKYGAHHSACILSSRALMDAHPAKHYICSCGLGDALASSPSPTLDYSGLCSAPSCEGHCGYAHARGCEAVREYLADHGGEPYRAPSHDGEREARDRKVAEAVRAACIAQVDMNANRMINAYVDLDEVLKEATRG